MVNSGLSGSLWVAVAGRFVTGLGGAGLIGIVSVIITGKQAYNSTSYCIAIDDALRHRASAPNCPLSQLRNGHCDNWAKHWTTAWGNARRRCRMALVRESPF